MFRTINRRNQGAMDVSRPMTLRNALVVKWFGTVGAHARYQLIHSHLEKFEIDN